MGSGFAWYCFASSLAVGEGVTLQNRHIQIQGAMSSHSSAQGRGTPSFECELIIAFNLYQI